MQADYSNLINRRIPAGGGLRGPGVQGGALDYDYSNFMSGLVGGEYEDIDRIFTGQVTSLLTGSGLASGANNNIQYGFESSCPDGVNQNTALLATAAAIGMFLLQLLSWVRHDDS